MKRPDRILTLLVSLLLATALGACSPRYQQKEYPGEHLDWMAKRISDRLELQPTQQARLEALKQEMLTVYQETAAQREADRQALIDLLSAPTLDRPRLLAIVTSHTHRLEEHAPRIVEAAADFYDTLDPEQQAEIREHYQERGQHRGYGPHW